MSVAYFIVLDKNKPGFDTFVNGKAIAHEGRRLDRLTRSLGLRQIDEYVSTSPEELADFAEEHDLDMPANAPPEKWFEPDEGLEWVTKLRDHIQANPASVRDAQGVLSDLDEYQSVLERAKKVGARWHFSIDY